MTYRLNRSMISAEDWVVVLMGGTWKNDRLPRTRFIVSRNDKSAERDFRADAAVGVDFEEERVPESAVDHVRLLDAGPEAVQARLDLRDHARVDDAAGDQVTAAGGVEAGDERALIAAVAQDAGRVGEEDEFLDLEVGGHRRSRGV